MRACPVTRTQLCLVFHHFGKQRWLLTEMSLRRACDCYTASMARSKEHLDELLKLSPDERSVAAEALLISLEDGNASEDVQQAWVDELQRRIGSDAQGIPADEVFAQGRARLKSLL